MPWFIRLHTGKTVGERATKGEALDAMREQRIEGARAIFVPNMLGKDRFVMLHTITVKNHSKLSEGDVSQMLRAIRVQCMNDFCPAYGLRTVDIVYSPQKTMPSKGNKFGVILLVDNEYVDPDELGHKTEEPDGTVYMLINVGAVLNAGAVPLIDAKDPKRMTVSAILSHCILEMIANPRLNRWVDSGPDSPTWAFEVCDPVETDQYRISGGTPKYDAMVSNFVLPEFWNPKAIPTSRYDWVGSLTAPFAIGPSGYAIVRDLGPGSERETLGGGIGFPWRFTKEIVDGRSVMLLKDNYIEPVNRTQLEEPSELDAEDVAETAVPADTDADEILQEPVEEMQAAGEVYPTPAPLPCEPGYVPPVVEEPPVIEEPAEESPPVEETPAVEEPEEPPKSPMQTCGVCDEVLSPADPRASFIIGICGQCIVEGKTAKPTPEPEPVAEEPLNECPMQLGPDDPDCAYDNACPVHGPKPDPIAEPVTEPDVASQVIPEAAPDSAPITKNDRESIPEVAEPEVLPEPPALPVLEEPATGCADC